MGEFKVEFIATSEHDFDVEDMQASIEDALSIGGIYTSNFQIEEYCDPVLDMLDALNGFTFEDVLICSAFNLYLCKIEMFDLMQEFKDGEDGIIYSFSSFLSTYNPANFRLVGAFAEDGYFLQLVKEK